MWNYWFVWHTYISLVSPETIFRTGYKYRSYLCFCMDCILYVYIYSFIHIFTYIFRQRLRCYYIIYTHYKCTCKWMFFYIHSRSMKDNLSLHAYSKTCSLIQLTVETENQSLMSINYIKIILKSKYSWALF